MCGSTSKDARILFKKNSQIVSELNEKPADGQKRLGNSKHMLTELL